MSGIAIPARVLGPGESVPSRLRHVMVPDGWDLYPLCQMLTNMEERALATFALVRGDLQHLLDVDAILISRCEDIFAYRDDKGIAPSLLFMRMCSASQAAARLVMSGQNYEARAVLRSMLECAVYGHAMAVDRNLRAAWARRDDDKRSKDRTRNLLKWGSLMLALTRHSAALADRCKTVYDDLIGLGAHPNPGGILGETFVEPAAGGMKVLTNFGGGDPQQIKAGIRKHLEVLHVAYGLAQLAMPEGIERAGIAPAISEIFARIGLSMDGI